MSDVTALLLQVVESTRASTSRAVTVIIDDISMTPNVTKGFPQNREGAIFWKCFLGSLRTKILFLTPIGLLLKTLAPNAIKPLLGIGGIYLAYEGTKMLLEKLGHIQSDQVEHDDNFHLSDVEREQLRVKSVIKTDVVLSAEIMAVSLSALPDAGLSVQLFSLLFTALVVTILVFGSGYLIVRSDNLGAALKANTKSAVSRAIGRFVLAVTPKLLTVLSWVGVLAMLWVGGQLMIEGLDGFGHDSVHHWIIHLQSLVSSAAPIIGHYLAPLVGVMADALFALFIGLVLWILLQKVIKPLIHRLKM